MTKVRTFYGHEGVVWPLGLVPSSEGATAPEPDEATSESVIDALAVAGAPPAVVAAVISEMKLEEAQNDVENWMATVENRIANLTEEELAAYAAAGIEVNPDNSELTEKSILTDDQIAALREAGLEIEEIVGEALEDPETGEIEINLEIDGVPEGSEEQAIDESLEVLSEVTDVAEPEEDTEPDIDGMDKPELQALAEQLGVDSSGRIDHLRSRLRKALKEA